MSAKTGEGIDEWRDWLARRGRAGGGARVTPGARERRRRRAALAERTRANADFFDAEAERLARLCHRMAERFARGGRLIAFGRSPAARSDARHVAVEFVHPVIVGQARAARDRPGRRGRDRSSEQVELLAEPDDIAIGFGADEDAERGRVAVARERGCLTLAFAPAGAEWEFEPPSADPSIRQELVETLYHVLWELVHVFFDHRGLLEGRERAADARHRRVELPLSVPGRAASTTSRRSSTTCAARCSPRRARSASCARRRSPTTATS